MTHSQAEKTKLCWLCEKNEATEPYVRGKQTRMVCATCLENNRARDALEDRLIYIINLEHDEQYDAALACLDEIMEANRHRDHDLWLARSIAMHRSAILFNAGRYVEVEESCEAWAQLGFRDVLDRWMHAAELARTLDALGRPREALAVVGDALGHQEPKYIEAAMLLLIPLVELSKKLGQPVDPKWRGLTEAWAKHHRIDMPVGDSLEKTILELEETILELDKIRRAKQPGLDDEGDEDEAEGDEP
jgi:tetratricopeptide (TPR) repeat protein